MLYYSQKLKHQIKLTFIIRCDDIDIYTGKPKNPDIPRPAIGTAHKMQSAMTHKFGRDFGRGAQYWTENPINAGKWLGNPSISVTVTQYIVSLNRRKVRYHTLKYQ